MFYSCQLWLYSFVDKTMKTNKGIMHVWHEGTAGRGSSELRSCLNKVLRENESNTNNLYLSSDGCVGQNKNRAIVVFLQSLIKDRV